MIFCRNGDACPHSQNRRIGTDMQPQQVAVASLCFSYNETYRVFFSAGASLACWTSSGTARSPAGNPQPTLPGPQNRLFTTILVLTKNEPSIRRGTWRRSEDRMTTRWSTTPIQFAAETSSLQKFSKHLDLVITNMLEDFVGGSC